MSRRSKASKPHATPRAESEALFLFPAAARETQVVAEVEPSSEPPVISSEAAAGLPNRPAPISGNTFSTTGVITRRGVSTYMLARDQERYDTPTGVAIKHIEGKIVAEVEMRNNSAIPDHSAIRQVALKLGGIDEDVLDICIANAMSNGPSHDGLFTIDVDAIIAARDSGLKQKREGTMQYNSGAQNWARQSVIEALDGLDKIYVSVDNAPRSRRGKMVREYDRVFNIRRKIVEEHTDRLIAISYSFGDWFEEWQDYAVLAPQALLALDGRNGAPAKAFGRYFTLLAGSANSEGEIIRPVREVLETVRRSLQYGKNPQRIRSWLEDNLAELVDESVIRSWRYHPVNAFDALPVYKWVDAWLDLYVAVRLIIEPGIPKALSSS